MTDPMSVETGVLAAVSPREEILRTCRLLMAPSDVHEVRCPKTGRRGTISGYFAQPEALADAVMRLDGNVPGIYITLNPCRKELLARAANRLRERAEATTSDADIVRRRWLLLDFDARRPAGISASAAEHGRAMAVACAAWDDLRRMFGDPVVADSGNGAHLLYRLELSNNQAATALVRRILAGVAARCGSEDVAVDQTVFNAARIVKLWGTLACKGDSTPDRPHRRSRLLELPEDMRILALQAAA